MTYTKPTHFREVLIEGATARLEESLKVKATTKANPIILSSNSDFIYVPELGIEVAKERKHFGLNWNKTHEVLQSEGLQMLNPREFFTFIKYLQSNPQEYQQILDDILKTRDPLQGEWLDAKFKEETSGKIRKKEKWYLETNHKLINGKLEAQSCQDLENCIREDTYVTLDSINSQGLPTQKSPQQSYQQNQNIYYWHPRNGTVAGFGADSGRASLSCYVGAEGSDASLGVRPSRKKN